MSDKSKEQEAEEFIETAHDLMFGGRDLVHPSATKAIFLTGYEAGRADALKCAISYLEKSFKGQGVGGDYIIKMLEEYADYDKPDPKPEGEI